ncbi:MAG: class I SAM-dependent methyltransferase [Candidatus Omnitrophica bacterium]|nr:class I SAM-dependent methyltransferase [Candidatus Omnitrophota bacterium]
MRVITEEYKNAKDGKMNLRVKKERWGIAQKYEKECWELCKKKFEEHKHVVKGYWDFHLKILESFIHIERKTRILEIGTGIHPFINYVMKCEKYALDPLMDFYAPNSEISLGAKCIKGIGEAMPFPSDYFDIVIATNTLDHVKSPSKVLSEINRVLKEEGVLYLTLNCYIPLVKYHRIIKELLGAGDKGHPYSFSIKDVGRLIKDSGLKVLKTGKGIGDLVAYLEKKVFLGNRQKVSNLEKALRIFRERGIVVLIDRVITEVLFSLGSKFSQEGQGRDYIFVAEK